MHLTPGGGRFVRRDVRRAPWWTRGIARRLADREARSLQAAQGIRGVPVLLGWDGDCLDRSYLEGRPMQEARPADRRYFSDARRLLMALHARHVAHNDTAKEPNWLVLDDGRPALIDFQLATVAGSRRRRSRLWRTLAREDLRHLLKHKRQYVPDALTGREARMLARRAWPARVWMATGKPVYWFVTRKLLGWADREGAGDRR